MAEQENKQSILLYSPDMDFCMSLRLLFQEQYEMVTTTDQNMLVMMTREFRPNLVIIDSLPTEHMKNRCEIIKKENPFVRIMFFYAPLLNSQQLPKRMRNVVDIAFSKPVDIEEITLSIRSLIQRRTELPWELHQ